MKLIPDNGNSYPITITVKGKKRLNYYCMFFNEKYN